MVREHRSTIYTVCYMFSTDKDEVAEAAADLHFEVAALQEMYDHVKD